MDSKTTNEGYEIKRAILFENDTGFALGKCINEPYLFVTWKFNEENGKRDYYWGHYTTSGETAARDYESRIFDYQSQYRVAEKGAYKYYSTQRPVDIGTFPKIENTPTRIVNFDVRENVESGNIRAWGYLVYDAPLTEKQIEDYELRAAPNNPDILWHMNEQAQTVGEWEEKRKLPNHARLTEWDTEAESFTPKPSVTPERMAQMYEVIIRNRSKQKKPIAERMKEGAEQAAKDNAARTVPPKKKEQDISG